ncbi:myosin-13-like [Ptychodera flava]|uniref:myosin-13-like n=1 Tax=Ptychodera flava TaxID=63121 RepID=UPI00396A1470
MTKESVDKASDIATITKESVEQENGEPGDKKPNIEDAVLKACSMPNDKVTKLLAFKADKDHRFLPSAEMYLPTIFNVDNYIALREDQWDFIQFTVKMTEKIQHILSTRQEILSVLGVREFFVTDTDCETHDLYGLADQFLKHGRAPLYIKSSAKPYSLSARSLIPYKVSHTLVDQKGQRSLELDLTDRNEALKLALTKREEDIAKLRESLSSVENTVRQLKRENTAEFTDWQNKLEKSMQEKSSLELQLENSKQEVLTLQGLLKTEKENLKGVERACTKATLESREIQGKLSTAIQKKNNLEQRLESAEIEVVKVQDMNKKQQSELVRADEIIKSQLVRIKELESKGKQSEIPRVDKSTCTPSLPEKTLEQISEAMSVEETSSSVEPKPIGGTHYIGEKQSVRGKHGGKRKISRSNCLFVSIYCVF